MQWIYVVIAYVVPWVQVFHACESSPFEQPADVVFMILKVDMF